MYISARERQILEILLTEKDEITVKDLADQIGVSGRTVHRDLKNVEDILTEYDLTLQKKSGVGVQISGSKEKIGELELFLFNLFHTEYTPDERQTIILCALLESNGPVKLLGLANDLNVTIATVSADLTKLEERLQTFGLALIRRRGYGVEIEGDEGAKRRAMSNLISEYLDESEILSLARENIQKRSTQQINTISERLLGLVEKKKLLTVEKIVESIIQDLPFNIADSAFIGLVVHLALAVERIQKGEGIKINHSYLENHQSSKEYKFAEKIVAQLEQVFQIEIPDAEIAYITMHLKGAKLRHDNEYLIEDSSLQIAIKSRNLMDMVGKRVGLDLTTNRSLFEGLVVHLKPAIYRIKQKMGISNPLLDKIKRDYAELFATVKQAVEQVFHEFYVPDEEIGYLVMHFGAAILANKDILQLRTLVICSSGIGTSKMLATRLQQEFPELKQIQNVSVMEFKKMKADNYQLIISTIPIPDYHLDYILVSPILYKDEIEKIRSFINEQIIINGSEKKFPVPLIDKISKKNTRMLIEEMKSIQGYAKTIAAILEGFALIRMNDEKTVTAIMNRACKELLVNKKINDIEAVVDAIFEREKLGGLGIPGTSMALFHARSAHVITQTFTIYVTQKPIEVVGMDQKEMEIKSIVLMLSPEETAESSLEVLSYLSSLLIESEESISVFQSDDKEEILAYLTVRFDQFFTEKLNILRSV
ncbi:BglG family transcription antiterminator [Neobacillus sp. OS1-33]|uniref:BglG family transcription antiterminator n=1 Tax=Neobacillus sp. OS1-33 TaxID=3070683 RepID=UPI0027E05BE9|nr:BglG family transcription antiterminator [Neobacillus sp. OS1-33]WML24180.1 BglG family transcription antiterminator [Neobacillus sp. OS1-33]